MYYQFSEVPGLAGKRRYVVINEKDNVATVVENLRKAEVLEVGAKNITLLRDIPEGHKFARAGGRGGKLSPSQPFTSTTFLVFL